MTMNLKKQLATCISSLLFSILYLNAQEAVHNFGTLKIHDTGSLGFHGDLINDGSFDENLGLAGFYNENNAVISGAFRPIFNDLEVVVNNHLELEVGVGITNNSNFVIGNIVTPREQLNITLDYNNNAFYTGETAATKVDGYSAITNKQNFLFPIGNTNKIRPLELLSSNTNMYAKAAYFYEDPNNPSTFATNFNTNTKSDILLRLSNFEFWDLDGEVLSTVKLHWDSESQINEIVNTLEDLRVVGWNRDENMWVDLGNSTFSGDFNAGTITSNEFIPEDYDIITFGESLSTESITLDNYILTPNSDGINDYLEIDAVALSPNNKLEIYNRWGRIVYSEVNYKNRFNGIANNEFTVSKKNGLPDGIYFYIISLYDIDIKHQGYLYINQ